MARKILHGCGLALPQTVTVAEREDDSRFSENSRLYRVVIFTYKEYMQVLNMDIYAYTHACCETPLWRQSRSEVLEVTEVVRSLADGSFSSSPGKRPSVICKMRQEQSCNSVSFASIPLYSGAAVDVDS